MDKYTITITREFGSLGRPIAHALSQKLGVEYYDRDIVDEVAKQLNLPVSPDQRRGGNLPQPFLRPHVPAWYRQTVHSGYDF